MIPPLISATCPCLPKATAPPILSDDRKRLAENTYKFGYDGANEHLTLIAAITHLGGKGSDASTALYGPCPSPLPHTRTGKYGACAAVWTECARDKSSHIMAISPTFGFKPETPLKASRCPLVSPMSSLTGQQLLVGRGTARALSLAGRRPPHSKSTKRFPAAEELLCSSTLLVPPPLLSSGQIQSGLKQLR